MQFPIGYRHFHPNTSINYQFNRWLPESREDELWAAARAIKDLSDVKPELLKLAESARAQGRWLHASSYYRGAEFFIPFEEGGEKLDVYKRYREMFERAFSHIDYQRFAIQFEQGQLNGIRIAPSRKAGKSVVIHGGFDSYMEEFFQWGVLLADKGYDVVLFEGPGQGASVRESKLKMSPEWDKPIAALLSELDIRSCALVGFSLGGYLAVRAAASDRRIERVVLVNALVDFLGCFLRAAPEALARRIHNALATHDRDTLNALGAQLRADPNIRWALDHGEYVSGTEDSFDFLAWTARMNTREASAQVRQPVLVTAGTNDHIVPLDQFFEQLSLLRHSKAMSARLYSETDHCDAHCQVGNLSLLFQDVESWLTWVY